MSKSELFYFIGKCLSMEEHPGFRDELIATVAADSIDWTKFVAMCSSHFILPALYTKFKSQEILPYLPEEVSEYLKEIYDLNLLRNKQILHQLQEVTAILNKGNVYPVYLKGAGNLIDGLYSELGERMIGDIDFLVPQKDYLLAARLLEKEGYSMGGKFYGDIESLKHYPRLFKAGVPADLEVHRLPVPEKYKSWYNPELIFKEQKEVSSLEGCFVVSDKHKIIHNFIHSQLSNKGYISGIASFRDLYDLYQLSKRLEVKHALPEIKPKHIAISYFVFAGKALDLKNRFYADSNFSSWLFTKKHTLNYRSKAFYYTYRSVIYITQRIIIGFTRQIIQSFYSRKMRQSVINRLSDRKWRRGHLNSYRSFFTGNK